MCTVILLVSEQKQAHVGMDPQKPTNLDTYHPYILCQICQLCIVFVICVHRRVVEGLGVGGVAWVCSAC